MVYAFYSHAQILHFELLALWHHPCRRKHLSKAVVDHLPDRRLELDGHRHRPWRLAANLCPRPLRTQAAGGVDGRRGGFGDRGRLQSRYRTGSPDPPGSALDHHPDRYRRLILAHLARWRSGGYPGRFPRRLGGFGQRIREDPRPTGYQSGVSGLWHRQTSAPACWAAWS